MPNDKSTKVSKPVEAQPVPSVSEPEQAKDVEVIQGPDETSGPAWEIVSVQFTHDVDIPNRGKLGKVAVGMAGVSIEESIYPDKPGIMIFTNPETMVYVPYNQCCIRYRLVENA